MKCKLNLQDKIKELEKEINNEIQEKTLIIY